MNDMELTCTIQMILTFHKQEIILDNIFKQNLFLTFKILYDNASLEREDLKKVLKYSLNCLFHQSNFINFISQCSSIKRFAMKSFLKKL